MFNLEKEREKAYQAGGFRERYAMDNGTETIKKIEGYGVNAEYHFCSIESDKVSSVVKAVCHICD